MFNNYRVTDNAGARRPPAKLFYARDWAARVLFRSPIASGHGFCPSYTIECGQSDGRTSNLMLVSEGIATHALTDLALPLWLCCAVREHLAGCRFARESDFRRAGTVVKDNDRQRSHGRRKPQISNPPLAQGAATYKTVFIKWPQQYRTNSRKAFVAPYVRNRIRRRVP